MVWGQAMPSPVSTRRTTAALSPTGVFGDPRPATAEKGERIIAHVVAESAAVVRRVLTGLGIV